MMNTMNMMMMMMKDLFRNINGGPNRPSRNMTRYGERLSGLRRSSHFSEMSDAKAVNCTFPSQGVETCTVEVYVNNCKDTCATLCNTLCGIMMYYVYIHDQKK